MIILLLAREPYELLDDLPVKSVIEVGVLYLKDVTLSVNPAECRLLGFWVNRTEQL